MDESAYIPPPWTPPPEGARVKWLIALSVASLCWGGWATYHARQADTIRDSVLAVSAFKDSVALGAVRLGLAYADSAGQFKRLADSLGRIASRPRPKPLPVPPPDSTPQDSIRFWQDSAGVAQEGYLGALGALEARQQEVGALREALIAQEAVSASLRLAYTQEKSRGDGLANALRKQPRGCAKLLGLFPVPRVGPSYGVLHGLDFAVMVPLGCS